MSWEVEFTDEFASWWTDLDEDEQDSIDQGVGLLEARGPSLPFPYSSDINGSKHGNMRELRVQHRGEPYRVFYAFDPRRSAILLIGGNKDRGRPVLRAHGPAGGPNLRRAPPRARASGRSETPNEEAMTMARKFEELRAKMSPERRQRNQQETAKKLLDLTLQELRQNVASLNQEDLAEILQVTQGYVSRLERQDDMLLSNLYAYVKALGGEVEIRAKFPEQEVRITQFKEIEKLKAALTPKAKQKRTA